MRKFLQKILSGPVRKLAKKYDSKPVKDDVFASLTELYQHITEAPGKKGLVINLAKDNQKVIIFSDLHKGNKTNADDFAHCEHTYLAALDYYYNNGYTLLLLGDVEELWKFNLFTVRHHNKKSIQLEKKFSQRNALIKTYGNHDVFWNNDPFAPLQLQSMYGKMLPIYEGAIFKIHAEGKDLDIFCTHGHQGDKQSDGNIFSAWFVAKIWAPLQAYLRLNVNTPAFNDILKTEHNEMMYEWSAQQENLLLITGHTHQPVFESMTHLERLYKQLLVARQENNSSQITNLQDEIFVRRQEYDHISEDYLKLKPCYFNSGCCCFEDGDITGIELDNQRIQLIKWKYQEGQTERTVLQASRYEYLVSC